MSAAQFFGLALLGVAAGASFVVQAAVNAKLRTALGSPTWAAFMSYAGGTLTMLIVLLAAREPWLTPGTLARPDWWSWTGGFFGAVYIVISILLLPRLGTATIVALIVLGQMVASVAFDHFGAFGVPKHAVDLPRIAGVLLLIGGVVLIRR